jgi:hypothetical protein
MSHIDKVLACDTLHSADPVLVGVGERMADATKKPAKASILNLDR